MTGNERDEEDIAMRHGKVHRKLGKKPQHRRAMFANMAAALIKHEQITTTLAEGEGTAPGG